MLREWPLVAFTLLGQMAVGVFLCFHAPFLVRGRVPSYGWRVAGLIILAFVIALTALAALVSFFHLRHPFRARHVLSNLRSSWLSREILFELVFAALVALAAWLAWAGSPSRTLHWGVLVAAGLAGFLFLLSMAKLYMLPSMPVWRGAYTPVSFALTTLVTGAITTELVVRGVVGPGALDPDLMVPALGLVLVEIVLAVLAAPRHGLRGVRPGPSLRPVDDSPRRCHRARIALLAAGLVFIGMEIATGANDILKERGPSPALLLAFALILAGETAGRFHFYGLAAKPED
jgi:anaerobic dimethyl sulfoxide reductase subunit C (anchor subunit)